MNYIVSYPFSTIFYLAILFLTVSFSYLASKSNNSKLAKIYIFIVILLLTCVAGFRGETVGIDTHRYLEVIENIEYYIGTYRIKPTEMGYVYYVIFLTTIIKNPQIVLFTSALITNSLIILRLWSYRQQIVFSFAVFLYVSMYFILTLNTMRQWIAISLVFFGIKYLFREKYFKFFLLGIVASTFHTSALISLILIPIFIFYKRRNSLKSRKLLLAAIILSPVIISISIIVLKSTAVTQYEHYFRNPELDLSLSWLVRVLIVLFIILFINPKSLVNNINLNTNIQKSIEFYRIIRFIVVLGLLVRSMGLFYEYTARAGLYFSIIELLLFSLVIKFKRYGVFMRFVLIFLALLTFLLAMMNSGYGQMPYIPFWKT